MHSVSAVSGKTLLLLEDLQNTLYSNLIQRVESDLNKKFQELIRRRTFFSDFTSIKVSLFIFSGMKKSIKSIWSLVVANRKFFCRNQCTR